MNCVGSKIMLDHNLKGKDLSWPGHPPHASMRFRQPADAALLDAIRSGQEVRIRFEGQERVLPAVPADVAEAYADSCAALVPPNVRDAMSTKEREAATEAALTASLLNWRAELVAAEGTPDAKPGGLEYVDRLLAKLQRQQGR
jgi:hypothetical protein